MRLNRAPRNEKSKSRNPRYTVLFSATRKDADTDRLHESNPTKNERKSKFIQTLKEAKRIKDNRLFTDTELNLYFEPLIYIFEKIDYTDCIQKLKAKGIDRLLLLQRNVFNEGQKTHAFALVLYVVTRRARVFANQNSRVGRFDVGNYGIVF